MFNNLLIRRTIIESTATTNLFIIRTKFSQFLRVLLTSTDFKILLLPNSQDENNLNAKILGEIMTYACLEDMRIVSVVFTTMVFNDRTN